MLSLALALKNGEKYHDVAGQVTSAMIARQLNGKQSFAVPVEQNGLACYLPLDVDSGGLPAIHALLAACSQRGLWAFGQYTPRPALASDEQHGYVYIPTELTAAGRLSSLGDELIAAVRNTHQADWKIENRAHGADTRLPFALHTHTGRFGELVLLHETIRIDGQVSFALRRLFGELRENSAELLPRPPETRPAARSREYTTGDGITIDRYVSTTELPDLLTQYGAKRVSRSLYYAVEEALCFGWIDGIAKRLDAERSAQRFTPRRARSHWTELNKERARRLIAAGLMTDAGRAVLPDLDVASFRIADDILAALQADPEVWGHFQRFPGAYQRIRIGYIEEMRRQPDIFHQRLEHFLRKTRQGTMFGTLE